MVAPAFSSLQSRCPNASGRLVMVPSDAVGLGFGARAFQLRNLPAFGESQLRAHSSGLRLSSSQPLLVVRIVGQAEEPSEWSGTGLYRWSAPWAPQEGLNVELKLPAPRLLAGVIPIGAGTRRIPRSAEPLDSQALRREHIQWVYLGLRNPGDLSGGLAREIASATLEVGMEPQAGRR